MLQGYIDGPSTSMLLASVSTEAVAQVIQNLPPKNQIIYTSCQLGF